MSYPSRPNHLTPDQKKETIAKHFAIIMDTLGLDTTNDSLQKTPERVAKMYVDELFSGLDPKNFPEINTFDNDADYHGPVTVRDITVQSFCEHHFLPFLGTAKVSYIPNAKIIGLSKLNRIVQHFARKPQVQERLTQEIYEKLVEILGTEDVAISITADHFCVKLRGVQDQNSTTTTRRLGGAFASDEMLQREFLG